MANTPQEVLSALVRDAADQQRALGVLPTPDEAAREFVPILESLDRKNSEAAPGYSATRGIEGDARRIAEEYKRKAGRDAGEIRKEVGGPDRTAIIPHAEAERYAKIGRRLNLLTLSPKYADRAKEAIVFLASGRRDDKRMGQKIWKLLADSRREFGPIVAPAKAPTLYSIGGSK